MAHVNYEHLTIFEEHEFNLHAPVFAGLLIVTKFPPCPHIQVEVPRSISCRELLRVLRENTGIDRITTCASGGKYRKDNSGFLLFECVEKTKLLLNCMRE